MTLLVISGVFGGLTLLVVSLRMATRIRPFKVPFGWDDGLILTVMVRLSPRLRDIANSDDEKISTIVMSASDFLSRWTRCCILYNLTRY